MEINEVWRSKEAKHVFMKILKENSSEDVLVTFDFRFNPRTTNVFKKWYIEKFYEPTGEKSFWILGKGLEPTVVPATIDPFDTIDPDKVLFGDYTGENKMNVWKEV